MARKKMHPSQSTSPAVSVIIPMYNAEDYISECLESVLKQTFQDYEVIVVDDCSTDDSSKIVESYVPKFNRRLRLTKTEKNSGGGGYIPRNVGLNLARGEYVFFIDADDFILLTALETLYTLAKENAADVVYTGNYYNARNPNDVYLQRDGVGKKLLKEDKEDEPVLTVDNPNKMLSVFLTEEPEGNFRAPWSKFARREFLLENNIAFPETLSNGGDFIWCINVYGCAKRFLRISTPLYFYRRYSSGSVTRKKGTAHELLSRWFYAFVDFIKALDVLANKMEILKENPRYYFAAAKSHFEFCLYLTREARQELTNQEVYEILYYEFNNQNDLPSFIIPLFLSIIDASTRIYEDSLLMPSNENAVTSSNLSTNPAVSVIIPLYNYEEYIRDCLDSLLEQTFRDFEVIIVDDCSTDKSVEIAESYIPKFNGRLIVTKMEKNTGSGGLPRNKGVLFSRGEYIQFLDADDMLTKTALAEMYALAKIYDADVIYCEKHYVTDKNGRNISVKSFQKGTRVDEPKFESENLQERVDKILKGLFVYSTCFKFVKRNLLLENKITFPQICPSEDDIWTYGLIFYAKRFLHVPNAIYIRRLSETSVMRRERTPQQTINFWLNPVLFGAKSLDELMSRHAFFKENPSYRYNILKFFIGLKFYLGLQSAQEISEDLIYFSIKDTFGERLGEYDVLVSALCTELYKEKMALANERKVARSEDTKLLRIFKPYVTARIDIKLMGKGDFQILNISDENAEVMKPQWLQKNGSGYIINSCDGLLKFVLKAGTDGQISLNLRGVDIRDPKDHSKRIPLWIDYTKLTVNGKMIFDTLTPVWHDKLYHYSMKAKADEEITLQMEWQPHKSDNTNESKVEIPAPKVTAPEPKVLTLQPPKVESSIPRRFNPFTTARIDAKFMSTAGEFQILSTSDKKASVSKPNWFQHNGTGYVIQSSNGELTFVAKATADGQINLNLRGMDVRNSEDWSNGIAKRIPYWIDYTKLTVNGKNIFNTRTSAWCDKPYAYTVEAKANEEIKIQVEWQSHKSDPNDNARSAQT